MFGILLAVVIALVFLVILMLVTSVKKSGSNAKNERQKSKNTAAIIRDATKKLSHDPHNVSALEALGEVYYEQKNYEKVCPIYATLLELHKIHPAIDEFKSAIRYGISAFYTNKYDEATRGFATAYKNNPKSYEVNYYMGKILFQKQEYEKAIACLKRALAIKPEVTEISETLAYSLFYAKKYRESLPYLKRVVEQNPENKEALFYFANAMDESGMGDKALKIFMHLRTNADFGAKSCLAAGNIHNKQNQPEKAIQDYEISLKLENVDQETKLAIFYKLAHTYLGQHNISKALYFLKQIQSITPNYRDVSSLINRYQELNQNSNLQAYLMSGTSDFVAICRKFVSGYYPGAFIKIEDIAVTAENVEVVCEVESSRWTDKEIFRFFRSSGSIGELYIRDLHSKLKELACDKAFCVTAGSFTSEAKKYVEGRPIDLIEKNKLVSILKKIDTIH